MCSVIRQAEKSVDLDLGKQLISLEDVYIRRLTNKSELILNDNSHSAKQYFQYVYVAKSARNEIL